MLINSEDIIQDLLVISELKGTSDFVSSINIFCAKLDQIIMKKGDVIYLDDPDTGWVANPTGTPYREAIKVFSRPIKAPCTHADAEKGHAFCFDCGARMGKEDLRNERN